MSYLSCSRLWAFLTVVLVHVYCRTAAPDQQGDADRHPGVTQSDLNLATDYLQLYYSQGRDPRDPSWREKRSAPLLADTLRDMQGFFGLNVTGRLDPETVAIMKTPRCGVPDVLDYSDQSGRRWTKRVLSYRIGRYTTDMPAATVDHMIDSALRVWARASPLTFVRSSSSASADIMVEFGARDHGDSYPFDGPQGTLAHAFGPGEGVGGDAHFDDDEVWSTGSHGFNLYLVAAHEFGHSLGLRHSSNPESLMYPTYKRRSQQVFLSSEDVMNINSLYGTPGSSQYYFSRPNWLPFYNAWLRSLRYPMLMQDKCNSDLSFDAVTSLGDAILFFKDRYLWIKYSQQCDTKEGPIRNFMPRINSSIDAAYSVPQKSIVYLFTGSKYWTMRRSQVRGRSKSIYSYGLPKEVERLDAAVHLPGLGHTLFFVQGLYWSYDENERTMADSYPRNISQGFPGVNASVSAAVHRDGFLHLFSGPEVLKYDYEQRRIISVDKANSWLGC